MAFKKLLAEQRVYDYYSSMCHVKYSRILQQQIRREKNEKKTTSNAQISLEMCCFTQYFLLLSLFSCIREGGLNFTRHINLIWLHVYWRIYDVAHIMHACHAIFALSQPCFYIAYIGDWQITYVVCTRYASMIWICRGFVSSNERENETASLRVRAQ